MKDKRAFEKVKLYSTDEQFFLTFYAPTPQNGETHSNNSSAFADKLFLSLFDLFVGLALKALKIFNKHEKEGK